MTVLQGVVLTHLNAALRLAELALRPPSPTEVDDGIGHKPRSPSSGGSPGSDDGYDNEVGWSIERRCCNRPISVHRLPRRALTHCAQLCMGVQPDARFPARSAAALPATVYGHFTQAIYRIRPIDGRCCNTMTRILPLLCMLHRWTETAIPCAKSP
jgi:hypothetical protein